MEVHCVGVVSESSSGGFCGSGGTGRFWTGVLVGGWFCGVGIRGRRGTFWDI